MCYGLDFNQYNESSRVFLTCLVYSISLFKNTFRMGRASQNFHRMLPTFGDALAL